MHSIAPNLMDYKIAIWNIFEFFFLKSLIIHSTTRPNYQNLCVHESIIHLNAPPKKRLALTVLRFGSGASPIPGISHLTMLQSQEELISIG